MEVWSGRVELPSQAEMEISASKREFGVGCPQNIRHYHKLGIDQFPYIDKLAKEAGFEADTRIMHTIFKELFVHKRLYSHVLCFFVFTLISHHSQIFMNDLQHTFCIRGTVGPVMYRHIEYR